MNWRTEIEPINSTIDITYKSNLLLLGSCFSDNIGRKFLVHKFPIVSNPLGTMFNPLSIAALLLGNDLVNEHIVNSKDMFYHLDVHSKKKKKSKEELQTTLISLRINFADQIEKSDIVFVTLGTAFVHEYLKTKKVIGNCHKLSSQEFSKRLLTIEEIVNDFHEVLIKYPKKKFIFTVSPVRHTKEGLSDNMLSKSVLRVACAKLSQSSNSEYFPSYEMVLDDLRDYRFYTDDLIHINKQGEAYIWENVKQTFFSPSTSNILLQIEKCMSRLDHRSFNPNSKQHIAFLEKTLEHLLDLNKMINNQYEIDSLRELILVYRSKLVE